MLLVPPYSSFYMNLLSWVQCSFILQRLTSPVHFPCNIFLVKDEGLLLLPQLFHR